MPTFRTAASLPCRVSTALVGALAALVLAPFPASAQVTRSQPGGTLSVVHAAAVTDGLAVTVDGVARPPVLAFASAQQALAVASGPHEVTVESPQGRATGTVDVGPGCVVSVVAARPDGPGRGIALRPHAECPIPFLGADRASVRLLSASLSVGPLKVVSGSEEAAAGVGEASTRISLPPGPSAVVLRRAGSPAAWRTVNVTAVAGHAYDLLVAGDGDTPVTTALFDVAAGSTDPIDPGTVVTTGRADLPGDRAPLPWVGLALGVGGTLLVARRQRGRRCLLAAVGVTVLVACQAPRGGPVDAGVRHEPPPVPALGELPPPDVSAGPPGRPVRITGPDVDAPVRPVAAADLPLLNMKLGPSEVAWLATMGPPGVRGFAVLAGHVSWGPDRAVFGGLRDLTPGAVFEVAADGGTVTRWEVEGAVAVPKGSLPPWLAAPQSVPRLALVTCDGPVVGGFHLDNLVVVAHLV